MSDRTRLPLRFPEALGLNATETEQLVPAATGGPQELPEITKSDGLAPLMLMDTMVSGASPELVTVTIKGLLVVPKA